MKKLLGGLGLLTLMAFFVFVAPGQAASTSKKITITPKHSYNVSKEVTLTGTVSSVVKKPSAGMLIGTHVMLNTANGGVDAHIGSYAGRDKRLDSLSQGETVKAVGMMTKTSTVRYSWFAPSKPTAIPSPSATKTVS